MNRYICIIAVLSIIGIGFFYFPITTPLSNNHTASNLDWSDEKIEESPENMKIFLQEALLPLVARNNQLKNSIQELLADQENFDVVKETMNKSEFKILIIPDLHGFTGNKQNQESKLKQKRICDRIKSMSKDDKIFFVEGFTPGRLSWEKLAAELPTDNVQQVKEFYMNRSSISWWASFMDDSRVFMGVDWTSLIDVYCEVKEASRQADQKNLLLYGRILRHMNRLRELYMLSTMLKCLEKHKKKEGVLIGLINCA